MRFTGQALDSSVTSIPDTLHAPPAATSSGFSAVRCRWEIAFVAAALLVVCGHLLIKSGLNEVALLPAASGLASKLALILHEPLVWTGLGVYGLGTLFWMAAVAQTELSLLYPLTSLNYILVAFLSYALFQETISMRRGLGIATIALGMVLLTQSRQKRSRS